MAIQSSQVHDARERRIGRQAIEQRGPGFAPLGFHGRIDDARAGRLGKLAGARRRAGEHDRLVVRRERVREFSRNVTPVGGQNPRPGLSRDFRRTLRHDHAPVRVRIRVRLVEAEDRDVFEAGVCERLSPDGGGRERVVRAVMVGEPPPAVQLPER